jgi:hypothetical protein
VFGGKPVAWHTIFAKLQSEKVSSVGKERARYRKNNNDGSMCRSATILPMPTSGWPEMLGLNPKKCGNLTSTKREPWKLPLPEFIEEL